MPTELLFSIRLAASNQIDEGLEGLNDPAKSASNLVRGPMWMHDCLEK